MGGIFDFFLGGGEDKTTTRQDVTLKQLPDYPEAEQARGTWAQTLQNWSSMPGYGAIQPDWNSIWQNAAAKVKRYYQGGPEGPGVADRIKSNLASRGMSDQPGAETQIARVGMQEGNQLQDIATQQATAEATMSEQGRITWLNAIMGLAGMKPSFGGYTSEGETMTQTPSAIPGMVGQVAGNSGFDLGKMFESMGGGGEGSGDMFSNLMGLFGGGESGMSYGDTGIGDADPGKEEQSDLEKGVETAAQIAKIAMMFL